MAAFLSGGYEQLVHAPGQERIDDLPFGKGDSPLLFRLTGLLLLHRLLPHNAVHRRMFGRFRSVCQQSEPQVLVREVMPLLGPFRLSGCTSTPQAPLGLAAIEL